MQWQYEIIRTLTGAQGTNDLERTRKQFTYRNQCIRGVRVARKRKVIDVAVYLHILVFVSGCCRGARTFLSCGVYVCVCVCVCVCVIFYIKGVGVWILFRNNNLKQLQPNGMKSDVYFQQLLESVLLSNRINKK